MSIMLHFGQLLLLNSFRKGSYYELTE